MRSLTLSLPVTGLFLLLSSGCATASGLTATRGRLVQAEPACVDVVHVEGVAMEVPCASPTTGSGPTLVATASTPVETACGTFFEGVYTSAPCPSATGAPAGLTPALGQAVAFESLYERRCVDVVHVEGVAMEAPCASPPAVDHEATRAAAARRQGL